MVDNMLFDKFLELIQFAADSNIEYWQHKLVENVCLGILATLNVAASIGWDIKMLLVVVGLGSNRN